MPTQPANEFEGFLRELRAIVHRFQIMGSLLHGENNLPHSWRSLLATLQDGGPQTIPQLAKVRFVSRQQIQVTVRAMEKEGLVKAEPNPMHRTSHLITLTPQGCERLVSLRDKEEVALGTLDLAIEPGRIEFGKRLRRLNAAPA